MTDPLAEFLKQGREALDAAPYEFFGDGGASNGVHMLWLLAWARDGGLLADPNVLTASREALVDAASAGKEVVACADCVGGNLRPELFTEPGRRFFNLYYRPGWVALFWRDLEDLFPDVTSFAEIPVSEESLRKVFELLTRRFGEAGFSPSVRQA
jgi:hypothetical protein